MSATLINQNLEAVENTLVHCTQTDVNLLAEAGYHIIDAGGKRLRPQLVFLSYLASGGQEPEKLTDLAAAVELVHTATLVHDDINDHSPMRRGRVTVHERWGKTFALLTGDYFFAKVYELMAPYGSPYNELMANACVRLVEGETMQAAAAREGNIDREAYKEIVTRKTGSLFVAAAEMGARYAGASEQVIAAVREYAHNLGIAFQIVDDVLDVIGDPEALGKPVGNDLVQGAGALMAQNGRKNKTLQAIAPSQDPISDLMKRLLESGAIELAYAQAQEAAERAAAALTHLPESPARDELSAIIELVLRRNK